MELNFANEILIRYSAFVDKCTVTGKYFWTACVDGTFTNNGDSFNTVQEAFDDAIHYLIRQ